MYRCEWSCMSIRSVHVSGYRSISCTSLANCASLNVLIGKNNAGKSNLFSAIHLLITHLRGGHIARPWRIGRPLEEFNQREYSRPFQIGVEFDLRPEINAELRGRLTEEAPHL